MNPSDRQRLEHICYYCEDVADAIETFGNSYEAFLGNVHYLNTVSMSIMQIGELVGGLSAEFKSGTRQMMWGLIKGMRNIVAHNYRGINKEVIWDAAINDIPALLAFCKEILAREEDNIKE